MICPTKKCKNEAEKQFTGEMLCPVCHAKALAQWFTPEKTAETFANWTGLLCGNILEPSAGAGTLIDAFSGIAEAIVGIEYDPMWAEMLDEHYDDEPKVHIACADFLEVPQQNEFDAVVMNPPYEDEADANHVIHAMGFTDSIYALVRSQFLHGKKRREGVWSSDFGLSQLGIFPQRPSYLLAGEKSGSPRHDYIAIHIERGYKGETKVRWL